MKKTKLLIPLLTTMTVVSPSIACLSSCSNEPRSTCSITFNADEGGTIVGSLSTNVYYGIKWYSIPEPDYTENDGYVFRGWFNGNHLMQNTDVISSDMTITAKFVHPTDASHFTWIKSDAKKVATVEKYIGDDEEVIIPNKYVVDGKTYDVTKINRLAFYNCSNISSIVLNNNIEEIDTGAFYGCKNLKSFHLSKSVKTIGSYILGDCTELSVITVDKKNQRFHDYYGSNAIFNRVMFSLVCGCKTTTIPKNEKICSIYYGAFMSCTELQSITLPDALLAITDSAFAGCNKLTSMYFTDEVDHIGVKAFADCKNLSSISLPNTDMLFRESAFENCEKLSTIDVSRVTFDSLPSTWTLSLTTFNGIAHSGEILINNIQQKEMWTNYFKKWVNFDTSKPEYWTIKVKQ